MHAAVTPCKEDNIPLPQDATGHPNGPFLELVQAPVDAEELLESFLGKAPQRVTRLKSQVSAWALGGNESSGEVHGYPLNLLDPYFEEPTEGEPGIALQEAWRPIFDEGTRARLDPLPGPGTVTTYSDICKTASVLLKEEQNIKLPSIWSEQYAAQPAPQIPLFPLLLNSHACGIAPGKCAVSVQRTAQPCLEVWKLPD
jgi:hypothetical protein